MRVKWLDCDEWAVRCTREFDACQRTAIAQLKFARGKTLCHLRPHSADHSTSSIEQAELISPVVDAIGLEGHVPCTK